MAKEKNAVRMMVMGMSLFILDPIPSSMHFSAPQQNLWVDSGSGKAPRV